MVKLPSSIKSLCCPEMPECIPVSHRSSPHYHMQGVGMCGSWVVMWCLVLCQIRVAGPVARGPPVEVKNS